MLINFYYICENYLKVSGNYSEKIEQIYKKFSAGFQNIAKPRKLSMKKK